AASDQFAFGCILYEMLTGRRAFPGRTQADVLSAILRDDPPPVRDLSPGVPAPLAWIVDRCLAKSPEDRYVATRDPGRDLQTLREHSSEAVRAGAARAPHPRARVLRSAGVFLAVLAVGAAAGLLVALRRPPARTPEFRRLTFQQGVVWRALFTPSSDAI